MSVVDLVGFVLLLLTAFVAVPTCVLFVELAAATLQRELPETGDTISPVATFSDGFTVLMPAH
ncbi:MAG: hypothetical protein H7306_27500, partial [Bacteriovorax sp.]|nr:hypothetical protein [Rhizobacter sp.]